MRGPPARASVSASLNVNKKNVLLRCSGVAAHRTPVPCCPETHASRGAKAEEDSTGSPDPEASEEAEPAALVPAAREERATAWGPFAIAKIYNHGLFIGFGATCGRHRDPASATRCKKSVTFGREALSAEELVVRLKRWLLAGVELEADWAADEQRKRHVALGGIGLRDFDEGADEAGMDAIVAALR